MSEKNSNNLILLVLILGILSYLEILMYNEFLTLVTVADNDILGFFFGISTIPVFLLAINFLLLGLHVMRNKDSKTITKINSVSVIIVAIIFILQFLILFISTIESISGT